MRARTLVARSLLHFRAVHCAVALGVGVGTAVLAGALIVGSSVRGSLRSLTLDRLGAIDFAAVGERYFREEASEAFEHPLRAATAVLVRASAEHAGTGSRASRVRIHGVDDAFWQFYGIEPPDLGSRDVLLNRRLAGELGAVTGEDVLLRFQTDSLIPAESVMGRKEDNVRLLRLRVAGVLEDSGPGRFGLSPQQQLPYNAFLGKRALQRALDQEGRANALFIGGGALEPAASNWRETFRAADARLSVRLLPDSGEAVVETERIVLAAAEARAVAVAAESAALEAAEVLTYLANSIEAHGRTVPYSTVTAAESAGAALQLTGGGTAQDLGEDELLLNDWAARDLGAGPGDQVRLTYFKVGAGGDLEEEQHEFRLAGVARMAGAAVDRNWAPTYKGMSDKTRIASWDPPFPVDLRRIRPKDEEYWDNYRAAPKAFVSLPTAKSLWTSRFGQLTSVRLRVPAGPLAPDDLGPFRRELDRQLDPADFGLALEPVKQAGLDASAGATDFAGLFVGFSLFLIASAAILVSLLFRLGVELRSREIGTLLATGHTARFARRLLFAEGALLAGAGCLIGVPGAVGYAWAMLYGLSTWWSDAVGGSFLELHVRWQDPLAGALIALALMLASIWLSLRRLLRLSPRSLLAGRTETGRSVGADARKARRLRLAAVALGALASALLGLSAAADATARLAAFFGAGTLGLACALVLLRSVLTGRQGGAGTLPGIATLGFRNGSRNPTRSVLTATLVACASFMIVTVAMNRIDVSSREPARESGDGGFRFVAEADVPLFAAQLAGAVGESGSPVALQAMRVHGGEDASCLNLYRPSEPTLASVPDTLVKRGGFAFQASLAETDAERENPWLLLERDFAGAIPVFGDVNSVMWILHLGLGDELEVKGSDGQPRRLVIAGLLSRSIFQSELVLSERNFLRLYPDHSGYQSLLVETEDPAVGAALEDAFADAGLDATRTADRLAGFLAVENTYLSTFQTVGGLGLLLGTLGLAVVMVRSVLERRGEIALLGALGFRRSAVSRLVLAENSFLLLFGVAAGTAAALLAVAPHLAGGSADPPWIGLALTLGTVVALGLMSGAAATAMALRLPVLDSLRRD